MDEKVYIPQVIQDAPFPQQDPGASSIVVSPSANQVYSPSTVQDSPLPLPRVAQELLSQTLNTRTRKILGEFQFTPSGAIQIGDYTQGVNGDVRISPNGILGRNLLGDTTFGLDTDGNLILVGEMRSGSTVTGGVTVQQGGKIIIQGSSNTDGTVIDSYGLVSRNSFYSLEQINGSPSQSFTTTSQVDVSGSEITISIPRAIRFLFLLTTEAFLVESVGNTADGELGLNIDGTYPRCVTRFHSASNSLNTRTNFFIGTLLSGSHTIKLQGKLQTIYSGSPSMFLSTYSWAFLQLGN